MSQMKTDVQMTLLSRLPVMLLSFLSVVFLTRLLGPEGNGVYTFTFAALNLFFTVIGFQLEGSLPVFLARDKEQSASIFSAIGILAGITIVVFALVLFVLIFLIPGGEQWVIPPGQPIRFFFFFLLISFGLRRLSTLILAALRGKFKFKAFNYYMILGKLVPALTYGGLLAYTIYKKSALDLFLCFKVILLVEFILLVFGLIILQQSKVVSFSSGFKAYYKPISDLSFKSLVSASGHFFNKRLDVWFVQFFNGTAMLGQYGLATQVTNFVSDAMSPFNQVLVPYIAESTADKHNEIVGRIARLNMSIAVVASVGIITTSWLFVPLIFGKAFQPAVAATQVLAVGILFISQRLVFSGYFKAINEMQYPVRAAWAGVVITVIMDLLLIPQYGIVGASWATCAAYGVTSFYLIRMAQRKLGFSLRNIFIVRKEDIQWIITRRKAKKSDR
jgi:O-antigen/teichoic acid export membrane protein